MKRVETADPTSYYQNLYEAMNRCELDNVLPPRWREDANLKILLEEMATSTARENDGLIDELVRILRLSAARMFAE